MASRDGEKLSTSPREDYNPLEDEMYQDDQDTLEVFRSESPVDQDDVENESPLSSLEVDNDVLSKYSITPPANTRAVRRNKEKSRSNKKTDGKELFEKNSNQMYRARVAIRASISDELANDRQQTEEIAEVFVKPVQHRDNSLNRKRRESAKTYKTSRSSERDVKHRSGEMVVEAASSVTIVQQQPIQVDSPNRFMSLNSKPVSGVQSTATSSGTMSPRRQLSVTQQECPQERISFHKIFSMLISMGSTVRKDKESKVTPYSRQLSTEQEVWVNRVNDLIWLELQANYRGKTMQEQDMYVCQARETVNNVLDEIMSFKINENSLPKCDKEETQGTNSGVGRASVELGTPFTGNTETIKQVVAHQMEGLAQVIELLNKLERAEKLYPTTKALAKEYPQYASEPFQRRVNALNLWTNITTDIGHKLQHMAKVLHVHTIEQLYWPWLYFDREVKAIMNRLGDPADTVIPEICVIPPGDHNEMTEESEEEYEDNDAEYVDDQEEEYVYEPDEQINATPKDSTNKSLQKNVRFAFGDHSLSASVDCDAASPETGPGPSDTSTPIHTPMKGTARSTSMNSTLSRSSSSMSLEEQTRTNIYHYYVDRTLKRTGLRKLLLRLKSVLYGTLEKAKQALEQPRPQLSYANIVGFEHPTDGYVLSSSPSLDFVPPTHVMASSPTDRRTSTQFCDTWVDQFIQMQLPSFKTTYLFLVRIILDVVHECLSLRLEQQPERDPSLLSIRQLIRECKEVLLGAVTVKQYYQGMVRAVSWDDCNVEDKFEADLEQFEEDICKMMEVYFQYIQTWMWQLQKLPDASKSLKNALEEEWNFTKQVCPHVRGGEAKAGQKFCVMASTLFHCISDFLESGMDECINQLYDSTTVDSLDDSTNSFRNSRSVELRQAIIKSCRQFKVHFHEARERATKALGFAKMLRKDLEIAADFNIAVDTAELLQKLQETSHVRLSLPHSAGYLMFIPSRIVDDQKQILQLLNVTCGREDIPTGDTCGQEGYLLLVKWDDNTENNFSWKGETHKVKPTAETTIALSHIEVEALMLVVIHSSYAQVRRKEFEKLMGAAVVLVSEQTSCHQAIADSLLELKTAALDLRSQVASAITQVDEKLNLEDIPEMEESEKSHIQKLYRETLHQCYGFGFEYHKEVMRLAVGEMRSKLAQALVSFGLQWMKFVAEKCERGRGVRPRWANQGLDFLTVVCDPGILVNLTDEEFADLKEHINSCITHVIGEKSAPTSPGAGFKDGQKHGLLRNFSWPDPLTSRPPARSMSTRSVQSDPASTPAPLDTGMKKDQHRNSGHEVELVEGEDGGIVMEMHCTDSEDDDSVDRSRLRRRYAKLQELEQERTNMLYKKQLIGRTTDKKLDVDYHINIRRVNFKWQRGFKIGEGQFGKVYTAVNMETGILMAMKEIRFQPNDHQTVKDIADEIKIFESICDASLVKYYGVEVHRDEMLIFMEYCDEGTIEDVARLGLDEPTVRKYTSEILVAVNVLHENGIMHRDIKGANIFLTSEGPLKLGDFGCAVKLKNHTTMQGEVNNMVGTTAFMAPEVITQTAKEGSGRAADIWSVGCVVIEMVTGKRPWHELENNFMIMFKVGMGGTPAVPDTLNEEGKDFLKHCLCHDPQSRWSADQLCNHPFVKVYEDDTDA